MALRSIIPFENKFFPPLVLLHETKLLPDFDDKFLRL